MAHASMTVTRMKSTNPPVKKNAFVYKLFDMLANPKLEHLIWWTDTPDSNTFALYPSKEFAEALSGYFKHGNVALFVRQLHMYGFHKVLELLPVTNLVKDVWEFRHLSGKFRKNDELLLVYIKRRLLLNLRNPVLEDAGRSPQFGHFVYPHPLQSHPPAHLAPPHSHSHHPSPVSAPLPTHAHSLPPPHTHPLHHAPLPAPLRTPLGTPLGHPYSPQTYSPVQTFSPAPPQPHYLTSTPPGYLYTPPVYPNPPVYMAPQAGLPYGRYMLPPPPGARPFLWAPPPTSGAALAPAPSSGPAPGPPAPDSLHFRGPWDSPAPYPRHPSLRYDPLAREDRPLSVLPSALVAVSPSQKRPDEDIRAPDADNSGAAPESHQSRAPSRADGADAPPADGLSDIRALASSLALDVRTLASSARLVSSRTLAASVLTLSTSVRLLYGSISHIVEPDAGAIGPTSPPRKTTRASLLFLLHDERPPKRARADDA